MRDMFKGVFCKVSHLGTKEACIGGETKVRRAV